MAKEGEGLLTALGNRGLANQERQKELYFTKALNAVSQQESALTNLISGLEQRNAELTQQRASGDLDFISNALGSDYKLIERNQNEILRAKRDLARLQEARGFKTPKGMVRDYNADESIGGTIKGLVTGPNSIPDQMLGMQAFGNLVSDPKGNLKDLDKVNTGFGITGTALSAALPIKVPGKTFGRTPLLTKTGDAALKAGEASRFGKLSGAALKSTAKAGATATREEMAAAAPFISRAGGDFEAGMRAYKASLQDTGRMVGDLNKARNQNFQGQPFGSNPKLKAGKNVAIPSPSGAAPSPAPTPSPSGAGMGNVPPRGASAPAAPAQAAAPNVATPSSSTLKKLLTAGGVAGTGLMLAPSIMDLFTGAEKQVAQEQAAPVVPPTPAPVEQQAAPAVAPVATQPAVAQPPVGNPINDLIQQLLLGGNQQISVAPQQAAQGGLISDADISQIQKLMSTLAPAAQQTPQVQEKPGTTSNILNALAKGLIAGGTGDPNAAFVMENQKRQEALAQEQLRRSQQELDPRQQFANQLLAQVLGNRLGVSGQKEVNAAQNQVAMQQQSRQIATQLLMLEQEQRNALARNDAQYAQQLELQKREMAARLEQIKAQTTGQLEFMLNPEIQKLLSGMGGLGGGNNQPMINQ